MAVRVDGSEVAAHSRRRPPSGRQQSSFRPTAAFNLAWSSSSGSEAVDSVIALAMALDRAGQEPAPVALLGWLQPGRGGWLVTGPPALVTRTRVLRDRRHARRSQREVIREREAVVRRLGVHDQLGLDRARDVVVQIVAGV